MGPAKDHHGLGREGADVLDDLNRLMIKGRGAGDAENLGIDG
jgi:hypothetical protein